MPFSGIREQKDLKSSFEGSHVQNVRVIF